MYKFFGNSNYQIRIVYFLTMIISLYLSFVVESLVIKSNIENGMYTTDEQFEQVRIPMMLGSFIHLITLSLFSTSLIFYKFRFWIFFSFIFTLMSLFFIVSNLLYWLFSSHFLIALGYVPSSIVAIVWLCNISIVHFKKNIDLQNA
jgi:hypothetical protein